MSSPDPTPTPKRLGAILLCGGESRRMGEPKAWLPFGPETLLQRVARLLDTVDGMDSIVVVAAPGQTLPPLPSSIPVIRDAVAGRGPLQGLAAGLSALPTTTEFVFASATDAPFLRPAWVSLLVALIGDHDLAIPFVEGYHHPLAALYRRSTVLSAVEDLLRRDKLRPIFLVDSVRTRIVEPHELRAVDPTLSTLINLNTPEAYQSALDVFRAENDNGSRPGRTRDDHVPPVP